MSQAEFSSMIIGHQDFLRQLALKLTKSNNDSDDLMQETLFKALKNREKFQEGTNIKGWLYTIMKNTFINAYRKRKNQNTFIDETENKYFINMRETEKSVSTDSIVDHKYVMKQVNSIDKTYLETFMMYYNGYKYEEISEILDIPLGTVKSRIFLARRKMMDKLKDYR
ncbi:RNA polymerase sigma factor [Croceimicrobium sp.]|uniref:RNA polymerase sigma factor n=1 Tax=Croceimicrobium sp. TaxID=2828340 RepID=UPI003BA96B4C|tara:strand:+ start:430 stop:933 length:504 start_codon:yes stop_codon:yes gene_type:complete